MIWGCPAADKNNTLTTTTTLQHLIPTLNTLRHWKPSYGELVISLRVRNLSR
jgi:hypothetical protein